jgi:predicted AAA+ superfamily ATPase
MYREVSKKLTQWKAKTNRKPLVIYGARQVGKTWAMKEFGRKNYKQTAYILMSDNPRMKSLFEDNSDANSIISGLEAEAGFSFDAENTLIILDEVQEVPKAVAALKYIYEQTPQYHVMVAGSLLGVTIHADASFPVGKVNSLNIYPLNFYEFVRAVKSKQMASILRNDDSNLLASFHDGFNDLLKQYLVIGGMPEVVKNYAENGDYFDARNTQRQIISDYERDFSKHVPANIIPRLQMVFNSIPSQLAKENKKFLYGVMKTGARAKDYELAIEWLRNAGILRKIVRIKSPKVPLKHYVDLSAFKLFLNDVGLLGAMSNLEPKTILAGNDLFTEYKGALSEQFVAQELLANGHEVYYFSSDNAKSEVDFIIEVDGLPVPIEVKSAENLASKSLTYLVNKYNIKRAVKLSLLPPEHHQVVENLPLYLTSKVNFRELEAEEKNGVNTA